MFKMRVVRSRDSAVRRSFILVRHVNTRGAPVEACVYRDVSATRISVAGFLWRSKDAGCHVEVYEVSRREPREYLYIIQTHHKAHRQMSLLFEEFRFRPIAQKELQPAPTRWLAPGRRRRRCHNRPSRMCVRRSNAVASARAPSTPDSAVLPRVALPCTRFQSCRNTRKIQNRSKMSKESTHLCTGRGCHSQA